MLHRVPTFRRIVVFSKRPNYSPVYNTLHRRIEHSCFWNTTLCRAAYRQHFRRVCCIHLQSSRNPLLGLPWRWKEALPKERHIYMTSSTLISTHVSLCEVREKTNKMQQLDIYYQHFPNMFRASLCPSSGEQDVCYCTWCAALVLLDVVGSGCGVLRCGVWALWRLLFCHFTICSRRTVTVT